MGQDIDEAATEKLKDILDTYKNIQGTLGLMQSVREENLKLKQDNERYLSVLKKTNRLSDLEPGAKPSSAHQPRPAINNKVEGGLSEQDSRS